MKSAEYWIKKLQLQKHPEGGWFREIYRSPEIVQVYHAKRKSTVERNVSTSIYYLLEGNDFSAFHRIKSDETWHFYIGTSAIEILMIEKGELKIYKLGRNLEEKEHLQFTVPKNSWFAVRLRDKKGFALAGCTVSPGFQFEDFEMADKNLLEEFPKLTNDIILYLKS